VINHLQDCAKDYRDLDRVYVPLDTLREAGLGVESLGAARAGPALAGVIANLGAANQTLLEIAPAAGPPSRRSSPLPGDSRDPAPGRKLDDRLLRRDPLSERVHHHAPEALGVALAAAGAAFGARPYRPPRLGKAVGPWHRGSMSLAENEIAAQTQAAGSSFYAAMRLMPPRERAAMFAIYGFCPQGRRHRRRSRAFAGGTVGRRSMLGGPESRRPLSIGARRPGPPPISRGPVERYGLRLEDFLAIVDGMEMDVDEVIPPPALRQARSLLRSRCQAPSVASRGGLRDGRSAGEKLAHHLGRALQLTKHPRRSRRGRRHGSALSAGRGPH